jgi:hypothetical protein
MTVQSLEALKYLFYLLGINIDGEKYFEDTYGDTLKLLEAAGYI